MNYGEEIKSMSWREFERVSNQYPFKLPRIFSMVDDDILFSVSDIAELIGVKDETVRNWCRKGKLRVVAPIGKYMIYGEDLKEFMFERFKHDFFNG